MIRWQNIAIKRRYHLRHQTARKTDLFDGGPKTFLHIAPERCFENQFRQRIGLGYITADLLSQEVMVNMDITNIQYPDESFDVIFCSHVLEHVPDDRKAMREFRRVLKRTGWAILLVPVNVPVTFEDPSVSDPAERLRLFGQEDHVRKYGPDYVNRLREAGFCVQTTRVSEMVGAHDMNRLGLCKWSGEIYCCTHR